MKSHDLEHVRRIVIFASVVVTSCLCVAPTRSYGVTKEVLVVLMARPVWGSPGFDSCDGSYGLVDRPVVGDWSGTGTTTIGVFRSDQPLPGQTQPPTGQWFLRFTNTGGGSENLPLAYGAPGDIPVVGDWTGSGETTVGVYRPSTAEWFLRKSITPGEPKDIHFSYGAPGDIPVVGDWTGSGKTTIGVFRPSTSQWFLRNTNTPGNPDISPFAYGAQGDIPISGDWTGSGKTTIGVFRPSTSQWFLRNTNTPGNPDISPFAYGAQGDFPVVGHWNGPGKTTIGVFRSSTGEWLLRSDNSPGEPTIQKFAFGRREDPQVPRNSASAWQIVLDQQVTPFYLSESFNALNWQFKVVANPQPGSNGWWPAKQCSGYSGPDNYAPTSLVADAAQRILSSALSLGLITVQDIDNTQHFIAMDNRHTDEGQTSGGQVTYQITSVDGLPASFPFTVRPSVLGEGSTDGAGVGVIRHELGNQLGLPEVFANPEPCQFVELGGNPPPDDCVGTWDVAAFNANGFGVYERMLAGWLSPDKTKFENQSWSGSISVSPLERPNGDLLALILSTQGLLLPGSPAAPPPGPPTWQGYIVECRRQIDYDASLPSAGVLVSYFDRTRGSHQSEVIVRRLPNESVSAAGLQIGNTYFNPTLGVRVTYVNDAPNGSCVVSVNQ